MKSKVDDQFIPSIMKKGIYVDYFKEFMNDTFQKESLKIKLREIVR